MTLLIADTFTDSLARLTGDVQKAAKTTAFDLQMNPAQPGLKFHKLDGARDPNYLVRAREPRRASDRLQDLGQPPAVLRGPPR